MDVNLENLIEKIKKEGVEKAQHVSDEIVNKAKKEADGIVAQAKKEAAKIVEEAKKESARFQKNAELALKQAARDSVLQMKGKLTALFDHVFKRRVSDELTSDFLKTLILEIVEAWSHNPNIEIHVNEKDKKKLEQVLFQSLKKELQRSVTIKVNNDVAHGFRIGIKGESVYYDFSDESIADMLKTFLNPRLTAILDTEDG